jgi:hypothetical protein
MYGADMTNEISLAAEMVHASASLPFALKERLFVDRMVRA